MKKTFLCLLMMIAMSSCANLLPSNNSNPSESLESYMSSLEMSSEVISENSNLNDSTSTSSMDSVTSENSNSNANSEDASSSEDSSTSNSESVSIEESSSSEVSEITVTAELQMDNDVIEVGKSARINLVVEPANYLNEVTVESEDSTTATTRLRSYVKGVKEGSTHIVAKYKNQVIASKDVSIVENNNYVTYECIGEISFANYTRTIPSTEETIEQLLTDLNDPLVSKTPLVDKVYGATRCFTGLPSSKETKGIMKLGSSDSEKRFGYISFKLKEDVPLVSKVVIKCEEYRGSEPAELSVNDSKYKAVRDYYNVEEKSDFYINPTRDLIINAKNGRTRLHSIEFYTTKDDTNLYESKNAAYKSYVDAYNKFDTAYSYSMHAINLDYDLFRKSLVAADTEDAIKSLLETSLEKLSTYQKDEELIRIVKDNINSIKTAEESLKEEFYTTMLNYYSYEDYLAISNKAEIFDENFESMYLSNFIKWMKKIVAEKSSILLGEVLDLQLDASLNYSINIAKIGTGWDKVSNADNFSSYSQCQSVLTNVIKYFKDAKTSK